MTKMHYRITEKRVKSGIPGLAKKLISSKCPEAKFLEHRFQFANLELKRKLESCFFAIKPDGEISSQGFSWKSRLKFDWKARLEEEQDKAQARKPGPKLRLNYKQGHCLEKQKKA